MEKGSPAEWLEGTLSKKPVKNRGFYGKKSWHSGKIYGMLKEKRGPRNGRLSLWAPVCVDAKRGGVVMREKMAVLLLALLLAGCASPSKTAEVSAPDSAAPSPPVEKMSSSMVESAPRPLLETEIVSAYERAQRIYGWFDLAALPTSEESALVDGRLYYRVEADGIEDLEDLRAYLKSVFSRELTERLLEGEGVRIQYRDVDGVLYTSGGRRSRDAGKGAAQIETEQLDETTYCVNVMVDLLDEDGAAVVGLGSWSFPLALEEERWVFTDFQLVY